MSHSSKETWAQESGGRHGEDPRGSSASRHREAHMKVVLGRSHESGCREFADTC